LDTAASARPHPRSRAQARARPGREARGMRGAPQSCGPRSGSARTPRSVSPGAPDTTSTARLLRCKHPASEQPGELDPAGDPRERFALDVRRAAHGVLHGAEDELLELLGSVRAHDLRSDLDAADLVAIGADLDPH